MPHLRAPSIVRRGSPGRRGRPGHFRPRALAVPPCALALWSAALLAFMAVPGAAWSQQPVPGSGVTLRGEVVDAETEYPILGVVVELDGQRQRVTGVDGAFEFPNTPPGTWRLTAQMLGYGSWEGTVQIDEDTHVRIELGARPIELDTLEVAVREVAIRGRVRDLHTGRNLHRAEIRVEPNHEAETDVAGRFRIRGVRTAAPVVVEVQAFGYLPQFAVVPPDLDEPLEFELEEDPIAQAMIARQVQRLEERADTHHAMTLTLDREDALLREGWSANALVRGRFGLGHVRRIGCLVVNEREIQGISPEGYLEGIHATDVERLEIHNLNRTIMVRVYTRDFVRDMLREDEELGEIRFVITPTRVMCG